MTGIRKPVSQLRTLSAIALAFLEILEPRDPNTIIDLETPTLFVATSASILFPLQRVLLMLSLPDTLPLQSWQAKNGCLEQNILVSASFFCLFN